MKGSAKRVMKTTNWDDIDVSNWKSVPWQQNRVEKRVNFLEFQAVKLLRKGNKYAPEHGKETLTDRV